MKITLDAPAAEKLTPEHIKAHSHAWSRFPLTGEEQVFRATVTATAFERGILVSHCEHDADVPCSSVGCHTPTTREDAVRSFTKYASTGSSARREAISAAFQWLQEFV